MLLSPYRVLDLTDSRAELGPRLLADLGAEVIKVEPPGGGPSRTAAPLAAGLPDDGQSLTFHAYNRGKRSVALDLGGADGRAAFINLVRDADFLFENAPPGAMAAVGLSFADLQPVNPRLIYVAVTPFGQDGPYADYVATDLTLAAMGGMMAVNGDADRPPVRISVPQTWLHAATESAIAAMIALQRRHLSGAGQFVDVSVQTAVHWTTLNSSIAFAVQGADIERTAMNVQLGNRTVRVMFPCKDGDAVIFLNGAIFSKLIPWMARIGVAPAHWATAEDWSTYDVRWLTGQPLTVAIEDVYAAIERFAPLHTKQELLDGGLELGIFLAPSNTVADTFAFRHLHERGYWQPLNLADGHTVLAPGPWVRFSETPLRVDGVAPALGQRVAAV